MASNEQYIWNYLKSKGLNDFGVAGLMGNLYAESALNPKNLQQTFEKKLGHTDATYTESVDNGTYTNFVNDSAGYGLAQWTYRSRKQNLLNFAQAVGKSIGDLDMQLDFLWKELNDGYNGVLEVLRNATSVLEASNEVLFQFERPANQGASVQEKRADYGQVYYDKYVNTEKGENGTMSNSPLVDYTLISPNKTSPRRGEIDTITIHCVVGQCTVESLGALFAKSSRGASSNYGIGKDGRIGMYVEEKDRAWCSGGKDKNGNPIRVNGISGSDNDHRAITIEVASDTTHPYAVTEAAYEGLIRLLVDICKRNPGIKRLRWLGDKSLVGETDKQNMTVHRWFANKACVPSNSEVLTAHGWISLSEIKIGDRIACADLDRLKISFEEVYDKVPERRQDTYTSNGLTATKDHRMVYSVQQNKSLYRIDYYKNLLNYGSQVYIPMAGYANCDGLPFSDDMLAFYVAVQADGHYMYDTTVQGDRHYYGLEFHLSKPRKLKRLVDILQACHFEYTICEQTDGTTKIRIYNHDGINIVKDICERFLCNKAFTWDWLRLSPKQARYFMAELLLWDGCQTSKLYTSNDKINLDVVSAIAALNGVGSKVFGNSIQFRESPYITLGDKVKRNNHSGTLTSVTCVSVKTGIFLMRQNGKTFIVGNCPGDYLYERHGDIAAEVNRRLNDSEGTSDNIITEDEDMDVNRFKELWQEMRHELQDNDAGQWSEAARAWAISNGLIQGNGSTVDGEPNCMWADVLTREQFITVLYRFAQIMGKA